MYHSARTHVNEFISISDSLFCDSHFLGQNCGQHAKDATASSYCNACAHPDSRQCQYEIRRLCQAGYSQKYSIFYKYTVNFLWYKLGLEASKYCDEYLGYSSDKHLQHEAKCAIIDALVGQCEKERLTKPCPYEARGERSSGVSRMKT